MTDTVTIALTANDPSNQTYDQGRPLLPGMASESSVSVTGSGGTPGVIDIIQPDEMTAESPVTWSFQPPEEGWGASTKLTALVFGLCGSGTSAIPSHEIFKAVSGPILRDADNTWAQPIGTNDGFTYMLAPTANSWTLTVVWEKVNATGRVQPAQVAGNSPYLCTKFRCYFFTMNFGLWYVDPEFDLCPK